MKKILLNKYKSKNSKNITNNLNIQFDNNFKNIPYNNISKLVDAYDIFIDECNKSNKYKLICTINPICSNVLFNVVTEVSKYDSDGNIIRLTDTPINSIITKNAINNSGVTRSIAIRNTEYSHEDVGFQYFCGMDIFNNHLLRNKTFKCVNYIQENPIPVSARTIYNTIEDYMRLSDGSVVKSHIPFDISKDKINTHLYLREDIDSFESSFINNISEDNGWVGFLNKTKMETNRNKRVNKVINNKKSFEFIDFCPSRDMFSFTPIYNENKHRYEYNWDVLLTYPFSSTTNELISFTHKQNIGGNTEKTGIKTYTAKIVSNGNKNLLEITTVSNHNMVKDDTFSLYYKNSGATYTKIEKILRVYNVGDINGNGKNYKLLIDTNQLSDSKLLTTDGELISVNMYIRKIYNGCESDYYYRLLKTLPNLKNSKETPKDEATFIYLCEHDSEKYNIDLNKLGFSKTIYGDDISQGIVMDDIITAYNDGEISVLDNLGRPISELFVTILKKNAGGEFWYNNNDNLISGSTANEIEISHVFGKLTDGLDFEYEIQNNGENNNMYNVKFLTNVDSAYTKNDVIKSEPFTNSITNEDSFFYCDLVEYNKINFLETTLNEVNYRFNTGQRETSNASFSGIQIDNIINDDFESGTTHSSFTIDTQTRSDNNQHINIQPEGYYYKPHYGIKIRNTSNVYQDYKPLIYVDEITLVSGTTTTWMIKTKAGHGLTIGETIDISIMNKTKTLEKSRESVEIKDIITPIRFEIDCSAITNDNINDILIRGNNSNIPSWAATLNDGSGRYFWRDITAPNNNKIIDGVEFPFTNGSFYINKQINFFLKRQDPYGEYLSDYNDLINIVGKNVDYSKHENKTETEGTIC